ncbi:MAG: LysR family transcriptional regulator [Stappiaceae bacterium]
MRYFAAVAQAGSIRGASRELNIASSAVNRQILWLEEALGTPLFDRTGRGLRLTQAGEILLAHVKKTMGDFEATISNLDALRGLRRGRVRIATVESVADQVLPRIVSTFIANYPGIHLSVDRSGSTAVAELVEAGEADIGFTFEPPVKKSIAIQLTRDLPIGAVLRPTHPLAAEKDVSLAQCLEYTIALPAHGLSLRERIDAALISGPELRVSYVETNALSFMKALVEGSDTIGFMTEIGLKAEISQKSLVFRELTDEPLKRDRFAVITANNRNLALAPGIFFDHAMEELSNTFLITDAKTASVGS